MFASLSERTHNDLSGFIHRGLLFSFSFRGLFSMGRCTVQVGIRAVIARIGVGAKSRTTQRRRVSPAGVLLEVEYCPFFPLQYFAGHRLAYLHLDG